MIHLNFNFNYNKMHCASNEFNKQIYQWQRMHSILPHPRTVSFFSLIYPISAIHGHAPILAGDPPTMRVFLTFANPHPSSGFSSFPLAEICFKYIWMSIDNLKSILKLILFLWWKYRPFTWIANASRTVTTSKYMKPIFIAKRIRHRLAD